MTKSFKDKDTERFDQGHYIRKFDGIKDTAYRKLAMIDAAQMLEDLKSPRFEMVHSKFAAANDA